ncbi:MAG: Outer membrane protein assembly factor BamA precursor [bacterium ADurb.Bin270]|nr:MAG: Outer membrane protein assembly factor BamA precursor [bacterium ADurb.Bin270]HQH80579.1 outer membrane protein assembly factor BamA [bacterium]
MNRTLSTIAVIAAVLIFATASPSAIAGQSTVSEINVAGLKNISPDTVRSIMPLKVGDEFSWSELESSIGYLRKWGVFDVIEANPRITEEGVSIDMRLEEALIVFSIDIAGNYPYLENKIRKYLSLHAGDIYTPERVDEQKTRIEDFYKRNGFFSTSVYYDVKSEPESNGVAITYYIKRGEILRYRNINISGNKAYPSGRFISKINTLRPYSARRLKDAIRSLREFYKNNGYPKARIRIAEQRMDFDAKRVDLNVEVYEGPRVEVIFTGSKHLNKKTLRKALTIFSEGNIDQYEIEVSADGITRLLNKKGYPKAEVKGSRQTLKDGTILITFDIDEGKSQKIRFIKFEGRKDADTSKIMSEMRNNPASFKKSGAYYPSERDRDDKSIQKAMQSEGYLDAKVGEWDVRPTPQGYALDIEIPIEAGERTFVGKVIFKNSDGLNHKKLLKASGYKIGEPFDLPSLENSKERLLTFLADNGYPYAKVEAHYELKRNKRELLQSKIIYDIEKGNKVRIGEILIVGDVLSSQKAIKSAMNIKEGDLFSYRKIIESQLNIRRLGPFASVSVAAIGLEDKRETVSLQVKVEEQRPFLIDLGLNYSTDESWTGSMRFTNLNAFGWAKTNSLELIAGTKLTRAELVWHDPRFLGSSFEMTSNAWAQHKVRPAYSFVQVAGGFGWFRRYRRFGMLFRWELDRNYFLSGNATVADADSLRNNTVSKIAISGNIDTRDNFSDPRKGFYTALNWDTFNEIKGAEANFFRISWQGENDISLFDWLTFNTAGRFAKLLTIGSNISIPINEMLFLGGGDTIRGFDEDSLGPADAAGKPVGGRLRWIFNEEMRIRVMKNFQLAGFFDIGSLTDSFGAINWNTVRRSVGLGIRYVTPVGPIRVDYGFKLDRKTGESRGRVHITFGYVF